MSFWIKAPRDGECCDCQPAVCDLCCVLSVGTSGSENTVVTYDVTGQFTAAHDLYIRVTADAGSPSTARFEVTFNGVAAYDSGCISATSANTTISCPIGTTSIVMTITAPCAGGNDGWDFVICCAGLCT